MNRKIMIDCCCCLLFHFLRSSSPRLEQLTKMESRTVHRSTTELDEALEDEDSGYGEMLQTSEEISSTSSSSIRLANSSSPRMDLDMKNILLSTSSEIGDMELELGVEEAEKEEVVRPKRNVVIEKKVDLRSFFTAVSPTKKRRARSSDGEDNVERSNRRKKEKLRITVKKELIDTFTSSSPEASTSTLPLSPSISRDSKPLKSKSKSKSQPKKFEQLFLDPFETSGHSTLFCSICSMSYARTPDDMELHTKHHKRIVGGCDWLNLDKDNTPAGGRVIQDGIEWGVNRGGKIIMIDANTEGLAGKRVCIDLHSLKQRTDSIPSTDQGNPFNNRYRTFSNFTHFCSINFY